MMAGEYSSCSSSSETSFKENATQLSSIVEAFEELAGIVENKEELRLSTFCDACSLVSVLFGCLGVAFKFAEFDELSLRDAASTAYTQVCAPYRTWTIRKAVGAGMYTLPTRDQLILRLNETDESVEQEMRRYIVASTPVIKYIDNLFLSRNISLDW